MTSGRLLRHLDRAIIPALARFFTRVGGRPGRIKFLTAAGLIASAGVIVTSVLATHEKAKPRPGEGPAGTVVHVGVAQGQSIPGYVATSRTELESLVEQAPKASPEVYALVSLKGYLAPDRLTPVLGGVAVAEVYARAPNGQSQIVRIPAFRIPEDVVSGMRQLADRKEAEADSFRALAAKLSETDSAEGQLRDSYLAGAAAAMAEAAAYRSGCTCVYAAVVRAVPVALDQIASRPEVRAVDPAPEVQRLDQAVFLAPLPDQPGMPTSPTPVQPSTPPVPSPTASPPAPSPTPSPSVSSPAPTPTRSIEPLR